MNNDIINKSFTDTMEKRAEYLYANYKEESETIFHALPVASLQKSCYLLAFGFLIASVVLIIELIVKKCHKKNVKKNVVVPEVDPEVEPEVVPEKWTYAPGAIQEK